MIAWDRVHELRRKLIDVDNVVGNQKIDFNLARFDFIEIKYKITVDPDPPKWLARPTISAEQLTEIKFKIDEILQGDQTWSRTTTIRAVGPETTPGR